MVIATDRRAIPWTVVHELRVIGPQTRRPDLGAGLERAGGFATLEDVVRWPAGMVVEIVVQDEFTHDVVVECGGPPTVWVVFDTT